MITNRLYKKNIKNTEKSLHKEAAKRVVFNFLETSSTTARMFCHLTISMLSYGQYAGKTQVSRFPP